jgi:hypothetical protein
MKLLTLFLLIISITSCKKDPEPTLENSLYENGILCMNEGLFQQNNATLSYYDLDSNKTNLNQFSTINGRGLGDTANDMIEYTYQGKSFIAIAVDVSSQIEIIEASTLKSIKQISVFNGTSAREPRAVKYHENYLYSINFDGTVTKINLSTLSITSSINCGLNPERAEIVDNKMYVINSGGLNSPTYDNTISVIDLSNFTLNSTFDTDINCSSVIKDSQDELYLISRGNYSSIEPKMLRINTTNNSVIQSFNINITSLTYHNDIIYYFDNSDQTIHTFNTISETFDTSIFIDCSTFQNMYGIYINDLNQSIYLVDANGYTNSSIIRCYSMAGVFKYEFTGGLNTGQLLFK